jgi:endonuclease-8
LAGFLHIRPIQALRAHFVPEGDTVHATAQRLRAALVDQELIAVELPRVVGPAPATGSRVTRIEARGKHLLIWLSDGHVIHSHLRMTGVWRVYARGQKRRHSPASVRIRLRTATADAVCTNAPVVELLDADALARHPVLRRLGPDLTAPDPDIDEAIRRLADGNQDRSAGEALLDQKVASGIGNVYRSEVCFLVGIDPRTPLREIDVSTRRQLLTVAAQLLRDNVGRPRTTVPDAPPGALWVYQRTGRSCRRCGTPIASTDVGDPPRRAYWCPTCQPAGHP